MKIENLTIYKSLNVFLISVIKGNVDKYFDLIAEYFKGNNDKVLKFSDGKKLCGEGQLFTYFIKCDLDYISTLWFNYGGLLAEDVKMQCGFKSPSDIADYWKKEQFPAGILGCIIRLVPEMPSGYLPGVPKEIQPVLLPADDKKRDEVIEDYKNGLLKLGRRWGVLPDPFIYVGPDDDDRLEAEVWNDSNYEVEWEEIDREEFENDVKEKRI